MTNKQLLVIIGSILMGLIFGVLLGETILDSSPVHSRIDPSEADAQTGNDGGISNEDTQKKTGRESETNREQANTNRNRSVRQLLQNIPQPDLPSGNGTIQGSVRTRGGNGLSGVTVTLTPNVDWPRDVDTSTPDFARDMIQTYRIRDAYRKSVQTGESGTFSFTGLPGRYTYAIEVKKEGWKMEPNSVRKDIGEQAEFQAYQIHTLTLDIQGPDGNPVEEARIHAEPVGADSSGHTHHTWTEDDPELKLTPDLWNLYATGVEQDQNKMESEEIQVDLRDENKSRELQLEWNRMIEVQPTGEDLGPNRNVGIKVIPLAPDQQVTPSVFESDNAERRQVSGAETADFTDLNEGRWAVGISRNWRSRVENIKTVQLEDHPVQIELELPPFNTSEYHEFVIVGPSGQKIRDAEFDFSYVSQNSTQGGSLSIIHQEDNRYWINLQESLESSDINPDEEDAEIKITAESESSGGKKTKEISPNSSRTRIQLNETATLTVLLSNYNSSHPLFGKIHLQLSNTEQDQPRVRHGGSPEGKPNNRGRLEMGPVSTGTYELVMNVMLKEDDHFGSGFPGPVETIQLSAGKNEKHLSLPTTYGVTINVPEELADESFQLQKTDGQSRFGESVEPNERGEIILEPLVRGNYRLNRGMMGESMSFQIPGPSYLEWKPESINALQISIQDTDGFLSEIGFQDGDIVYGLNGEEFETQQEALMSLQPSPTVDNLKFMVERGGTTTTVTIASDVLREAQRENPDPGGQIQPTTR